MLIGARRCDQPKPSEPSGPYPTAGFSDLPLEKRNLAEKLKNVGFWAGRIAEVLSRFTLERIRANFHLYRRRAAEQVIRNPGAWLYAAITDGCTLPDSDSDGTRAASRQIPARFRP